MEIVQKGIGEDIGPWLGIDRAGPLRDVEAFDKRNRGLRRELWGPNTELDQNIHVKGNGREEGCGDGEVDGVREETRVKSELHLTWWLGGEESLDKGSCGGIDQNLVESASKGGNGELPNFLIWDKGSGERDGSEGFENLRHGRDTEETTFRPNNCITT